MEAPIPRLLARAARQSGHAARKLENKKAKKLKDDKWKFEYQTRMQSRTIRHQINTADRAMREDWATGNKLLPRRDVGSSKLTWGTMTSDVVYSPSVPEPLRKKPWLAVGDRVVILTGRDRGKIGTIDQVQESEQTVRVEGMNEIRYVVPDFVAKSQGREDTTSVPGARSLKWSDVKLVHAVANADGSWRDVIVDELRLVADWRSQAKKPKRMIAGTDVEVPWPEETKEVFEDQDADTLRMTVDERTFEPALNELPFPSSVMDELRHKYSKFRTRHEPEYIAQKERQASLAQRKAERVKDLGLTPFERLAQEHRAKDKVEPMLSEEQLAAIGEAMVKEKPELAARLQ